MVYENTTINPWGVTQQKSELRWSFSFCAATTPPSRKQSVMRGSTAGRSELRRSCSFLIWAKLSWRQHLWGFLSSLVSLRAERDLGERSGMVYEDTTINPWGIKQQQSELRWSFSFAPSSKQSVMQGSTAGRSELRRSCSFLISAKLSWREHLWGFAFFLSSLVSSFIWAREISNAARWVPPKVGIARGICDFSNRTRANPT